MSLHAPCPDAEQVAAYARDGVGKDAAAVLDQHFAKCRACLNRFLDLGRGSVVPNIPDCRVVKEIGRGRFGVVYKAWWLGDAPRLVALKVLSCPGDMEKSRFEREIAVLSKVDSPGIVRCLDSGMVGDALYFIMDHVEGTHLDRYLALSTLSPNEKLAVFERVCRAVAQAHDKGVIHRDLKPSNILIDADGQPHILDFGICALDANDWSSGACLDITQPGDVIGTLKYMSPEQAWGGVAGPVDQHSDIWSLGVMLYEIVTDGAYPYSLEPTPDQSAHEALLERIRRQLPHIPRLDSLPRGESLRILLERCLVWETGHRLDSASKLADDLDRYARGLRIRTKPLWIPHRIKRLAIGAATRSRWAFSGAFVALLAATLWATTYVFNIGWRSGPGLDENAGTSPFTTGSLTDIRDHFLVVGVFDDTVDVVVDYAAERNIPGVTADVTTWRAIHGRLMERLAAARPRAVVWDYYFRRARPGDATLVAGVERLEDAGVPVVLAVRTHAADGTPDLSADIAGPLAGRLRQGAIVARDMVKRPGEFVMAIKRGERTIIPSLVVVALAAVLQPASHVEFEWTGRSRSIELLYEIERGAYLRHRDRVEFTKVFRVGEAEPPALAGDLLACNTFALESPEEWRRRTVPYQTLLTGPDGQLSDLAAGKVLVIGDFRTPRWGFPTDWQRVQYGLSVVDDVPGCYLLADAIVGLLNRYWVKSAYYLTPTVYLFVLLMAVAGCLLPIRLAVMGGWERRWRRRMLWIVLLGGSTAAVLVMTLSDGYVPVHLGMAGFALLMPMTGSFWVEFVRNRHRIADRRRHAVEGFDLAAKRTITLASRPARSRPSAR